MTILWLNFNEMTKSGFRMLYFLKGIDPFLKDNNLMKDNLTFKIIADEEDNYNVRIYYDDILLREFIIERGIEEFIFYFEKATIVKYVLDYSGIIKTCLSRQI